ncbi:MAG: CHAT domain-containing protein [Oscillatoriaceae cyanobacterium Prado104]|nr:CHAT domain-containing protein [Oscillatoriaceae cyanobacterium Prado104]
MSQEFILSVTPVGDDEYLVRTERVAPGVPLAEQQVRWPVDEWLALSSQLMNDPLLGLLQGTASRKQSRSGKNPGPNLVDLGQQLYDGLFQGNLRDSWTCARGIAQHRREVLQLRLGLKGKRLPRLPWEVLHADDRPIAAGTDVIFSRYQPGTSLFKQTRILPSNGPLKILMAIASPNDLDTLRLEREVLHLQQELQRDANNSNANNLYAPEIQLTILEQPDREQLTQALEQGHYQVLHYAGHSGLGPRGGELYLVSNRTGLTETLSGDDLAGLLVNNGIQMAVFNSCRGAYGGPADPSGDSADRNLTEALVKRGIPAVLAMAERIPDDVALNLTKLFYRNLDRGHPVDLSLSRARAGLITAYGSHQLYWALPILYQHPEFSGYLNGTPSGIQQPVADAQLQSWHSIAANKYPQLPVYRNDLPEILAGKNLEGSATGAASDSPQGRQNYPLSAANAQSLDRAFAGESNPLPVPPTSAADPKSAVHLKPRDGVLPASKPPKKLASKQYFALAMGLLLAALGAAFFGWPHLSNRDPKPEELLPPERSPVSQNSPPTQPINLTKLS